MNWEWSGAECQEHSPGVQVRGRSPLTQQSLPANVHLPEPEAGSRNHTEPIHALHWNLDVLSSILATRLNTHPSPDFHMLLGLGC